MYNAIYGSRIYKGSLDKAKVLAAVDSPVNSELMLQLSKYVDKDSAKIVDSSDEKDKVDSEVTDESNSSEEESSEIDVELDHDETQEEDSEDVPDDLEDISDDEAPDEDSEKIQEVTRESIDSEVPGVSRVFEKNDEVWIAYNDDTNLDNILWDVVDVVSKQSRDSLKFNRVARSENAVVFTQDNKSDDSGEDSYEF